MKKVNKMSKIWNLSLLCLGALVLIIQTACSDNDSESQEIPQVVPTAQWSQTMAGNGETLGAYPDLYSNYWEFTYRQDENSDKIICIKGQYPYCRYMSFSFYNDETGDVIGGLDDVNIHADAGSINPFEKTISGKNYYTLYVVPDDVSQKVLDKLKGANICKVDSKVKKVMICHRQYLGTKEDGKTDDEFGGVSLPEITALDTENFKNVVPPEHVESNVYKITSKVFSQKSDENNQVPFFLAPVSRYYPNNSTSYLYARTHLQKDSILAFTFYPVTAPTKPEEYATADARYWSICLGSASDTRSYYSICDRDARYEPGKKAIFFICLKNNPKLKKIEEKVRKLNEEQGGFVNLMVWDSEKKNIDGKPIGEYITLMYRNILPNPDCPYSMVKMTPTAYKDEKGEPIDHVTDPQNQLAHLALGRYGPIGTKISTQLFLEAHIDVVHM